MFPEARRIRKTELESDRKVSSRLGTWTALDERRDFAPRGFRSFLRVAGAEQGKPEQASAADQAQRGGLRG